MGSLRNNAQLILQFLKPPFLCLPSSCYIYINDFPDDALCNITIYGEDTLYSNFDQESDLRHQLELAYELKSDLLETTDQGKKYLVNFDEGKNNIDSFDQSNNSDAINVKIDGSVLRKKSSFKILGVSFSSELN